MIADVICYLKMTPFMALDGKMSYLRLKDGTNTYNVCDVVKVLAGVLLVGKNFTEEAESWLHYFVLWLSVFCAMYWSAVCDCGVPCSCYLTVLSFWT